MEAFKILLEKQDDTLLILFYNYIAITYHLLIVNHLWDPIAKPFKGI
jgi:hypothetical protein